VRAVLAALRVEAALVAERHADSSRPG
jgi:hypothetical protein